MIMSGSQYQSSLRHSYHGAWTIQLSQSRYYCLTLVHMVGTDQFSNKLTTTTNSTNMCINKTFPSLQPVL